MDPKEQALVSLVCERIRKTVYDEHDVLCFLILLRPYANAGRPVREFADFVAHRERDRGALHRYLQKLHAFKEAFVNNRHGQIAVDFVHSFADFRSDLDATMERLALEQLSPRVSADVFACILSLLQGVRLSDRGTPLGHLALWCSQTDLQLIGLVHVSEGSQGPIEFAFPALTVRNRYCDESSSATLKPFPEIMCARCDRGSLELFPVHAPPNTAWSGPA